MKPENFLCNNFLSWNRSDNREWAVFIILITTLASSLYMIKKQNLSKPGPVFGSSFKLCDLFILIDMHPNVRSMSQTPQWPQPALSPQLSSVDVWPSSRPQSPRTPGAAPGAGTPPRADTAKGMEPGPEESMENWLCWSIQFLHNSYVGLLTARGHH